MGERHHEYLSWILSVCDDEFPVCNRADEKVDDSQRIFFKFVSGYPINQNCYMSELTARFSETLYHGP